MFRTAFIAALALFALASNAEARHRHHTIEVDPGCNIIFPCEGVTVSAQGERVVKAMGGFGTARKVYQPRASARGASEGFSGSGTVRSASGATAHVAAHATGAFQCLVTALDNAGYPIRFMGGWRAHGSVRGSLHPAGLALDVNQFSRNVTRPAMPHNEIALANSCGLVSGAQWANGDSGHFQLGGWAGGGRHYARRHRSQYASAP